MAEIILTFDKQTGEMQVNANGFQGQSCEQATNFLKSMGAMKSCEKKAEWYQTNLQHTGRLNTNLCG